MVPDFQEKFARPENVLIVQGNSFRLLKFVGKNQSADFARNTTRKGDKSLAVLAQVIFINARLIIKAFQIGMRDQFQKIFPAGVVLAEQNEMIILFCLSGRGLLRHHVCLNADNRFYAAGLGFFIKFNRAIKIAMVGNSQRIHAQLFGPRY